MNKTSIGYSCTSVSGTNCLTFASLSQEGWYYDAASANLLIHFRGSASTTLTISGTTISISTTSSTTSLSGQPSPTINPMNGAPPPASGDLTFSSGPPLVFPTYFQSDVVYAANPLSERFYLPQTVTNFYLKFYGSTSGSPATALYVAIVPDSNQSYYKGAPTFSNVLANQSASGITSNNQWISLSYSINLNPGYYWAVFTSSGGNPSNFYVVQTNNQVAYPDIYVYQPYQLGAGLSGSRQSDLGSVLWITDSSSNTLSVYPLLNEATNFRADGGSIPLKVSQTMIINTITFFVSDRAYDPYNISISLQGPSGTLATGMFSNQIFRGINTLSYAPVQLNNLVTLTPGVSYSIVFGTLPGNDNYGSNGANGISQDLITETANPTSAGYLGQTAWPLFTLGLMNQNYAISNGDYLSSTDLFDSPGYTNGGTTPPDQVAMRFLAHQSETLQSFSVNVIGVTSTAGFLNITLRSNSASANKPTPLSVSPALAYGTASLSSINSNLTSCSTNTGKCTFATVYFSGNTQLTAGQYYWIVLTAPTGAVVNLNRLIDPYNNLVYTSYNDYQTEWGVPSDGPSDLSYKIITSGETISNTYLGILQFAISPTHFIAQSFTVPSSIQLKGLLIPLENSYNVNVAIETDSSNSPSGSVLGSGTIPFFTPSQSMGYASLTQSLTLNAGTKYWIVISGSCAFSSCSGSPYVYANQYRTDDQFRYGGAASPYTYETKTGSTWSLPTTPAGDMPFILSTYNSSQIVSTSTTVVTTTTTSTIYVENPQIVNVNSQSYAEQLNLSSQLKISNIQSNITMLQFLYNSSVLQITFPSNKTVSVSFSSPNPSALYADGRLLSSWSYSGGVVTVKADPSSLTMFYPSTSTTTTTSGGGGSSSTTQTTTTHTGCSGLNCFVFKIPSWFIDYGVAIFIILVMIVPFAFYIKKELKR